MTPPSTMAPFAETFERLTRTPSAGGPEPEVVRDAFDAILAGEWTSVQIAAFAAALRMRGDTTETLGAAARSLRAAMTVVDHGLPETLDTCGTGGDGRGTVNVSTAAAVLVASLGVAVAKHGNRSVSSRSGSADVLEALGLPLDVPPLRQHELLREVSIAFLLAPAHHPALRHAAVARRELGVRTIFNALGPLVNPANVTAQLVGVYDDALRPKMAHALARLGVARAWVVRSLDGLDEISPEVSTRVSVLSPSGEVEEREISPDDFGIPRSSTSALTGGSPAENASMLMAIFRGENVPAVSAVVLNAAAALHVARGVPLREAAAVVAEAQRAGRGADLFVAWTRAAAARAASGAGVAL